MNEADLHLACSLLMFAASAVPVYLSVMLRGNLRKVTVMLSIFVLIHSLYHVTGALGMDFLSDSVFEPLSIVALISFGLAYARMGKNTKGMVRNERS